MKAIIALNFFILIAVILAFLKEGRRVHKLRDKEWRKNNRKTAIDMLLEDISKAKKRILFYCGKGTIYGDNEIIDALQKKEIPIEMIFENTVIPSEKLKKLVQAKDNFFVNLTAKKLHPYHFRVIDYDYVYVEKPHPDEDTEEMTRYYKRFFKVRFLPAEHSKAFYRIKQDAILA